MGYIVAPSRGSNSVVECHPSKVDVAGSNPVSRSNFSPFFRGKERAKAAFLPVKGWLLPAPRMVLAGRCFAWNEQYLAVVPRAILT